MEESEKATAGQFQGKLAWEVLTELIGEQFGMEVILSINGEEE